MKEYQTPQKEHSRYSDLANRRSKESQLTKPHKVPKKSLTGAFSLVSEDVSSEITKESSDFSPNSENSDANHSSHMAENSVFSVSPTPSAPPETSPLSVLSPASKITAITYEPNNASAVRYENTKPEISRISPVEADIAVNLLKQTRTHVFNTTDLDDLSKELLEALIEDVIKQICNIPAEIDSSTDLVYGQARIVLLLFLTSTFTMFMILFLFGFGFGHSYDEPPPT